MHVTVHFARLFWPRPDTAGRHPHTRRAITLTSLLCAASFLSIPGTSIQSPAPTIIATPTQPLTWTRTTLATGLSGPDGIALDSQTGDLFVAEENRSTIVRIATNGSSSIFVDSFTPIYNGDHLDPGGALQSPEGLALDGDQLYVVEDRPGGRILSFPVSRINREASSATGTVINLPIQHHRFAWESIDTGPAGSLLIAGSEAESSMASGSGSELFFRGVVLYRDTTGTWWVPLRSYFSSYSAVAFYDEGRSAVFVAEMPGEVGCINLASQTRQTWTSPSSFLSPEGVAVLPDHTMLVAEESGAIYHIDPLGDTRKRILIEYGGGIESVLWQEQQQRLIITDDAHGTVEQLSPSAELFRACENRHAPPFTSRKTVLRIPKQCPDYLAGVLKRAGYDPDDPQAKMPFPELARRLSLVAMDAVCEPVSSNHNVADPIQRIQFAIFAPQLFYQITGGLLGPVSAFAAVSSSGEIQKTRLVDGRVVIGDQEMGMFSLTGHHKMIIPFPLATQLNEHGIASIHFMGGTIVPDYHLVVDLIHPDESYMLVSAPGGGASTTYKIQLPSGRTIDHWVLALPLEEPETWLRAEAL